MKNLIERSESLCSSIDNLQSISKERKKYVGLETRCKQIKEARDALDNAKSTERVLCSKNIVITPPEPSKALRSKVAKLQHDLDSNWRELVSDPMTQQTFLDPIKKHADAVNAASLKAWKSYVDADLIHISDEFIGAMSIAGFKEKCDQLKRMKTEIQDFRKKCPKTSEDIMRVESLKSEIQIVWNELKGIPIDVVEFLQKAARRQAKLDDIRPGIRDWLKDNGMIDKLWVGLG